jgi:hypothetical protein
MNNAGKKPIDSDLQIVGEGARMKNHEHVGPGLYTFAAQNPDF